MSQAKSFKISKYAILKAYERVKANKGSEGIDGVTIKDFEENLQDNLYKIWNRMSSGTYFPPPVRTVEIPKSDGKKRKLGIPTVGDRIAQMVVKMYLEPDLDPCFHPNSYGYRPNKSAKDAIGVARKKCWDYDWVIDLDIKGFFDNMDHDLVMKALNRHTDCKWILLYVERWLKAPAMLEDGTISPRTKGTPQGGVISPILANLFMHYAFDEWMRMKYPLNPFERYADDIVIHCKTEEEAEKLLTNIKSRLMECNLEVHPIKTKIVYCKDDDRNGEFPNIKFDFLGYTFKMRDAKNKMGKLFMGFLPAVSDKAATKIREKLVELKIHSATDKSLNEIAEECNPIIRGWMNYYGKFYKSALDKVLESINDRLVKWATKKFKRFHGSIKQAGKWISMIQQRDPKLFAHW
ncbi:MAG: group II intron reverse transcriptase/maturase [Alphaproteobacteria bacterium]|nr:group II intron reverse transcriptase/maturase [Alphaproteobacteria bacterium]